MNELLEVIGPVALVGLIAYIVRMEQKGKQNERDFSALKIDFDKIITEVKKEHSERIIHVSNGKKALKNDLNEKIQELKTTTDKRIENVYNKLEKNDTEFKQINQKLATVEGGIMEVKGMLQLLINNPK